MAQAERCTLIDPNAMSGEVRQRPCPPLPEGVQPGNGPHRRRLRLAGGVMATIPRSIGRRMSRAEMEAQVRRANSQRGVHHQKAIAGSDWPRRWSRIVPVPRRSGWAGDVRVPILRRLDGSLHTRRTKAAALSEPVLAPAHLRRDREAGECQDGRAAAALGLRPTGYQPRSSILQAGTDLCDNSAPAGP